MPDQYWVLYTDQGEERGVFRRSAGKYLMLSPFGWWYHLPDLIDYEFGGESGSRVVSPAEAHAAAMKVVSQMDYRKLAERWELTGLEPEPASTGIVDVPLMTLIRERMAEAGVSDPTGLTETGAKHNTPNSPHRVHDPRTAREMALATPDDPRSSDPEMLARHAFIKKRLLGVSDTMKDYSHYDQKEKARVWSEERKQLHEEILAEMERKYADVPSEGKSMVVGGAPGSGKTRMLNTMLSLGAVDANGRSNYVPVNPDDFKMALIERGADKKVPGLKPQEAVALTHEEASYLAKRFAQQLMAKNKNILWDLTMSSPGSILGRVESLRNAGYKDTQLVFLDAPRSVSMRQAGGRWKGRDGKYNGRWVDLDRLSASYDSSGEHSTYRQTFNAIRRGLTERRWGANARMFRNDGRTITEQPLDPIEALL